MVIGGAVTSKNYWHRISEHRLTRRRAVAATGGTAAAAAFFLACGGDSSEESSSGDRSGLVTDPVDTSKQAKRGGVLKLSERQDVANFDPYFSLVLSFASTA